MKVRFFLNSGMMIEWPVPEGEAFSFPALCQGIRASGFFMIPDAYIAAEAIGFIALEGSAVKLSRSPMHQAPPAKQ